MFLDIDNEVCYIDEKEVISVSVKAYGNTFNIEVIFKRGMSIINATTEKVAKKAVENIIENINKVKLAEEKTYLGGFRDGTEYALKLMERKS